MSVRSVGNMTGSWLFRVVAVPVISVVTVAICSPAVASASTGANLKASGTPRPALSVLTPEVVNPGQLDAEVIRYLKPGGGSLESSLPKNATVADIRKLLKREMAAVPPRYSGPTAPAPAPKKKETIGLMSCSNTLHGCVTPLNGAEDAAKALGWKYIAFNGAGSATTENKNLLTMVADKVNAIMFTSINPATIQQGLEAAKSAGIPVFAASSGSDTPNPVVRVPHGQVWPLMDISQNFVETGAMQATWIIANSNGHANVLVLTDKEYTSGISQVGVAEEFYLHCPHCTVSTFNFSGTQVGAPLATEVVGYLRAHPSIDYVDFPYDPAAAAVVPAMEQAGEKHIKVCSLLGDAQNLNFVRTGEIQACDGAYDNTYAGWAMVDQFIRLLDHKPFSKPVGENLPQELITRANVPARVTSEWSAPYTYAANFKKLWGIK